MAIEETTRYTDGQVEVKLTLGARKPIEVNIKHERVEHGFSMSVPAAKELVSRLQKLIDLCEAEDKVPPLACPL